MEYKHVFNKIKFDDLEYNLDVLHSIRANLLNVTKGWDKYNHIVNLYANPTKNIDRWFFAQCISCIKLINKLIDNNDDFYKNHILDGFFTKDDILRLSQEIIYDISMLNYLSGNRIGINDKVCINRANYISSEQFFLNAKFAVFSKKAIVSSTSRDMFYSLIPTLIRQAIETKIKNSLGIESIEPRGTIISISNYIKFIKNNKELFCFPVSMDSLSVINKWTNTFIHTGVTSYIWQSMEAIDIIEPMFTSYDENKRFNLNGFYYHNEGVTLNKVEEEINKYFLKKSKKIIKFKLNENFLVGVSNKSCVNVCRT